MSIYHPLSTNAPYGLQESGVGKFPHTRAQLSAIARQYKTYETDAETDDYTRVPPRLVNEVVSLLIDEREDDLKALLKSTYGIDDETVEQNALELMHKHRDDIAGVPFLFLTPTRRPISRPSSRASTPSNRLRPDTPSSAPNSPLASLFRRPHTPATSPLAPPMSNKSDYSPSSSPVLAHTFAAQSQFTASLPASPISSPRLLNAKASEFRPIPRPLSAAASHSSASLLRAETPSPDMWAHNSPRATSNLAIAAPLIAEQSFTPSSSLRSSHRPKDDEDEDDPFDPFASNPIPSFASITISDFDTFDTNPWSTSPDLSQNHFPLSFYPQELVPEPDSEEASAALTDGMTPFDVLSSVFGSTLAPSELEEALAASGFDFDRAMAWLVDRALPAAPTHSPQNRMQHMGARVTLVSRDAVRGGARGVGFQPAAAGRPAPRYTNGRPVPGGNRVCRYFVAGECLRADCRFSHDLERALCRFWLRGTCAKQDSCEFLHHLPKDVDISSLNAVLARANVPPGTGPLAAHTAAASPPPEEFPVLGFESPTAGRGRKYAPYNDPSRTRFAAAVKKPAPQQDESNGNGNGTMAHNNVNALTPIDRRTREALGAAADNLHHQSAIVAPKPSPRLKLRPPLLLPTLPTGEAVSAMYMSYRQRALQLGAARNACLSRAADAWRRGDGAAAKRFSREGHELNAKMAVEMGEAAGGLVIERARMAEGAVRARDAAWSDDPGDRAARGKACGGGYGVVLGIAGAAAVKGVKGTAGGGAGGETSEERTEAILDLHGLHANEATEVLEKFLLALEHEHFYGLAYAIVGEEKHTGTQDVARGASRARLATGVREWLHRWGYPWSERDGIICIDPLTHLSE
ncbi:hypothetical protein GALMADRAFT_257406 [Galerina marginata CBS 339.88]|uniref:C3H1-type domain-containing protein n=1 Tax=Galerina marginata (strain CBS 339.88) TaxID=685588 RepID=A0A067SAM8_GALM3|nr:hypothetical protein GALMADRAFT_257406 [Galerina marginata CBS 339.88]